MQKKYLALLYIPLLLSFLFLATSCGELAKVKAGNDISLKYDYAKKMYNLGKYKQAAELLNVVLPNYEGSHEGSRILYMLAYSEFEQKNYLTSSELFVRYYTSYPDGEEVESARFFAGKSLYHSMPDPRLDQTVTYAAIQELQLYNEMYPNSKRHKEISQMLFDLQDNLAKKQLLTAKLYYDLGMYLGNNYKACIIVANNALKKFPYNNFREDFYILLLRATYKEAVNSVEGKLQTRYRDVVDRYFIYTNEFPHGKYIKEADKIYGYVKKYITEDAKS